ncbi:unnamed protein product [Rhizophagus irregularis]|nr:unnamed protein product [Rhizophagus irregularis]
MSSATPVYNFIELGLEEYEKNEMVLDVVHDLMTFFKDSTNCTCRNSSNKKDLRTCFEKKNGLIERTHGNTGRVSRRNSKVFVDFNITSSVKEYLVQYGTIYGLPSPMRYRNDSENFIYLPTGENYTSIYKKYKEDFYLEHDESETIISYSTFRRLWHELIPNLKFQPSASDLCEKYQYEEHHKAADLERKHYNDNIEKSKQDLSIAHICYDWAQNVSIPYSPQQVGSIFFKTAYAVHLFGVCKTEGGENRQINFVITEDEFPKGVSKGANTTLNMVYQAIKTFAKDGKKDLHITCDNCIAQNKNNLSLFFWSWLSMLGWYNNITINFMIPGHTKFICDSFFGHIKKTYQNQKVNTVDDIEDIVNNSSKGNEGLRYNGGIGWKWFDFQNFFSKNNFINLPHITKYHHFRFSNLSEDLGKVYCSENSGGVEICHKLLRDDNNFNINEKLDILDVMHISEEKKKYLYQKIRQHIEDPYKDVYYL